MIAILNIGPAPGNRKRGAKDQPLDRLGDHLYQVKINTTVKAVFTHRRGESLATCLRKAADAVETANLQALHDLVRLSKTISHEPTHHESAQ